MKRRILMKRLVVVASLAAFLACLMVGSAFAFDFLDFAQNQLLQCAHPTADPAKAKVEFVKEPVQKDEATIARVVVYYKGWMKDNEMLVDIVYLKTSYVDLVKAEVLKDTAATGTSSCKFMSGWQEVK